jgi:hypothetical protein
MASVDGKVSVSVNFERARVPMALSAGELAAGAAGAGAAVVWSSAALLIGGSKRLCARSALYK